MVVLHGGEQAEVACRRAELIGVLARFRLLLLEFR